MLVFFNENCHEASKTAKMAFLIVNNFLQWVFKNTDKKNICVSIVFKAESESKHKENIPWPNTCFLGGKKIVLKI